MATEHGNFQHALETLERDRDEVVARVNELIRERNDDRVDIAELAGKIALLCERVPFDLKERLTAIQGALSEHDAFRKSVYKLVGGIIMAFALAAVAFVIAGGLKVTR